MRPRASSATLPAPLARWGAEGFVPPPEVYEKLRPSNSPEVVEKGRARHGRARHLRLECKESGHFKRTKRLSLIESGHGRE